ncbi:heparinase II/III family protein [Pelagibacteraceae bacterium]|nr:heparinase II/III family protein [Pelagibacteraceae bacterium]
MWGIKEKDKIKFENLHSFLWLAKLDRKNSKIITKNIIESWINSFFNYHPKTWDMEITARRIIAWSSNTDITLEDASEEYKEKFFLSLLKQSNFLTNNLSSLFYGPSKIVCCAGIILSGMIFKENYYNFKIGIKELEKVIKNYFDENGFPKSRNPEEVFICIKYLILIREWFKEAQKPIPDFLNEIIRKCGDCYRMLSCTNNQFPLFNGATEINNKDYDIFLKTLKYKFNDKNYEAADLIKIKIKKIEFYIDCGNPPPNNFAKYYQAGCLSFELISNKQKIICNSGYGKYLSPKLTALSRSTAAHSTLYINDTSSSIFQKNNIINKVYGNSLIEKHKIIKKNYTEDKNFYSVSASHNGYEKSFGYVHTRLVKISKNKDQIFGQDKLVRSKIYSNPLIYFIRFHIYPGIKIVKTKAGNSVLISLLNGEGWLLKSDTNNFKIEKNIFFGNKNKIINNESISILGNLNDEIISINWEIEKVN